MTAPLDGVKAKLDRARVQAEELKAEVSEAMNYDARPSGTPKIEQDPDTGEFVAKWSRAADYPLEWSVTLGEFFHNLRSAMDHIAWQIVATVAPQKLSNRVAFPICTKPKDFEAALKEKVPGVRSCDGYGTAIEGVQPYRASPEDPFRSILWLISRLNNIDKHRLLYVVEERVSSSTISFATSTGEIDVPLTSRLSDGSALKDQTEIARFPLSAFEGIDEPDVKMHIGLGCYIALGKGTPIQPGDERLEGIPIADLLDWCIVYMDKALLPAFDHLWSCIVQLTPRE